MFEFVIVFCCGVYAVSSAAKATPSFEALEKFLGGILASGVGAKGIRSRMGMPLEEVFLFLGMRRLAL